MLRFSDDIQVITSKEEDFKNIPEIMNITMK